MSRSPAYFARDAALLRLKAMHPQDFAALYDEERVARGLNPLEPRRLQRIAEAEAVIARLSRDEDGGGVGQNR